MQEKELAEKMLAAFIEYTKASEELTKYKEQLAKTMARVGKNSGVYSACFKPQTLTCKGFH